MPEFHFEDSRKKTASALRFAAYELSQDEEEDEENVGVEAARQTEAAGHRLRQSSASRQVQKEHRTRQTPTTPEGSAKHQQKQTLNVISNTMIIKTLLVFTLFQ